jgi:tetratricopeptide (TPR) repeat protein
VQVEQAQDPPLSADDAAREAFWEANDLYAAGDYARAIELFERAHELSGEVALLFNIAQCRRKLGECERARGAFTRYIAAEPQPPAAVQNWLSDLEVECTAQESSEPGANRTTAEASVSASSLSASPAEEQLELSSGSEDADGVATGMPFFPAGVNTPEVHSLQPTPTDAEWPTRQVVGWSLVGAGSLAAGAGIWFGLKANDDRDTLEQVTYELTDTGALYDDRAAGIEDDRKRHATLAVSFGAAAIGLGVTGAILLLTEDEEGTTDSGRDGAGGLGVVVTPSYSGAAWSGRFGGVY